jgi:ribosomal-protein-alanine N-acetyltransferase
MSIVIRLKNYSTLTEVVEHLIECDSLFNPKLSSRVDISEYSKKIVNHAERYELYDGDKLIGLLAIYHNRESGESFITNVSVCKEYQGRGLSRELIKDCLIDASNDGIKRIRLEVNIHNHVAIKLYRSIGFIALNNHTEYCSMVLDLS